MQKLYEKSEIWFTAMWIIVYVVGASVADSLSTSVGIEKSVTFIFLLILSVAAFVWMKKNSLLVKYGLCKTNVPASNYLYYLPLAFLASVNLWFGVKMNLPIHETILYMGSMICVGFLEEVIFRGFLFKAMSKDGLKSAIIVSSITFGIGHIVNLFNGSGMDLVSNFCQVGSAIAFGFLFVILFHRGKSLWPCIITHSVLNALSVFANETNETAEREIIVAVVLTVVAVGYAVVLGKTVPQPDDKQMYAYHVVTERPMHVGQQIIFDDTHHNGVHQRVYEKMDIVKEIYLNPSEYDAETLEHHTSVALRELALEEVRQKKYPTYPSRMSCLYVSKTLEEAESWGQFFARIGRPTYHIVKLEINGNCFAGDATKCFKATLDQQENLNLAELYWESAQDENPSVCEMLVDGQIKVVEVVKEINANIVS